MSIPRWLLTCAVIVCVGCQSLPPTSESWVPPRSLGQEHAAWRPTQQADDEALSATQPTGELTLQAALALALMHNPDLATVAWDVRVAEAAALQAGLWPNPEIEFEAEEIARGHGGNAFDGVETSVRLSQPIITAGKLAKRVRAARLDAELAGWDYETRRLDVFTKVVRRFVDVIAHQEALEVERGMSDLATQVYETVAQQVDAGAVSPVQRTRTSIERSTAQVSLRRAERELAAARDALAATWGGDAATFDHAVGDLEQTTSPPSREALARFIVENPDVARWASAMAQRQAQVDLAQAQVWPDVTVSAGVQYLDEGDDAAGLVSFSVPLPLFDRNQGGILEARFNKAKALQEQHAAAAQTRAALNQAYHELASAYDELVTLRDETLPAAQTAYDDVRKGYKQGSFVLLDVLDAQRTLYQVRRQRLDALRRYHHAAAEVERLIGRTLSSVGMQDDAQ